LKKDIEIPIAKDIFVTAVQEWNDDKTTSFWNAYLINDRDVAIDMLMVVSKGYDTDRKTAVMRHNLGLLAAKSTRKIEMLHEALLTLNNEFYVSYFADNKLYEKKFIFRKDTITEQNLRPIPLMEKEGILAE
tara:strand:- start:7176 stop:7571 length:396 start_codon:yes stop_codon:yes gene_type:complete